MQTKIGSITIAAATLVVALVVLAVALLIATGGPARAPAAVQGVTNLGSLTLADDLVVGASVTAHGGLALGDTTGVGNGTRITLSDATQLIDLGSPDASKMLRIDSANGKLTATGLALNTRRAIQTKTANYTLLAGDSHGIVATVGATDTLTLVLPAASAGLEYCVYVGAGQTVNIDTATGDQIHTLTNAAGDKIANNVAGSSVCLAAADATNWLPFGASGTWSDAN